MRACFAASSPMADSPWDAYMASWERKRLPEVLKRFFPVAPTRYLDFACGTGRITVNRRTLEDYFPRESHRIDMQRPLIMTENHKSFDVRAPVTD